MDVTLSSGGKYHAYHLARGFQKHGHLSRFITTLYDRNEHGIPAKKIRQIPIPEVLGQVFWRIPSPHATYYGYYIRDNLFDLWSRRFITGGDLFNVFNHFGLYAMRRAKALGMKVVVERGSAHPLTQERLLREEYARYGLRWPQSAHRLIKKHLAEYEQADAVAVISDFVKRTMLEEGFPEEKLIQTHLGFDPQRFYHDPTYKTDNIFRIIYVGALSLRKGLPYLLQAVELLNLADVELVLVGNLHADSISFLPQFEGHYRHVSFVKQSALPRLFNTASVFVLPSIEDGFGMVVYEAAACGLPVIVTENVGASIRHGQDGFIVPIRDTEALAQALLTLYRDPNLRKQMGHSAQTYVQQYTWANYHDEVQRKYRRLLE